jgi:hypothetical protein
MESIKAARFYEAWTDVIKQRISEVEELYFGSYKKYTNFIKGNDNCILNDVANELGLLSYPRDYYSIDAILYKAEDRVPGLLDHVYFFRDIRVAFEHENDFKSGLFQEVAHLLLMQCDLRVLVTYPNVIDYTNELKLLHELITGNRYSKAIANNDGFLIIFGFDQGNRWEGFIYKEDDWMKIG